MEKKDDMDRISKRTNNVRRVASRAMTDIVATLKAQGKEILPLKGGPYWTPPEHVLAAAEKETKVMSAPPSQGFIELRQAIANRLETDDRLLVDPEHEILITYGAQHALYIAFTTLLDPGDEVIMCSPIYFFYGLLELSGAVPVYAETQQENNWRWGIKTLEKKISSKTKMIIINSPNNPTGYVANEDDLLSIAELARKYDLFVLSDECYDKLLYDGARHIRFALLPGVKDRTITICSFTKSYVMPHWRIGFIISPPKVTPYLRKVLEWNVLTCNPISQRAAQAALEGPQDWIKEIAPRYQRNRDLMINGLKKAPGISFAIPKGAVFLFLNSTGLGISGEELSRTLMYEYGVPTEPGALFGSDSHVRLMFGGDESVISEAAKRITNAARKLAK
jgi:aspartate/methionine/tyrosine aminotransferase